MGRGEFLRALAVSSLLQGTSQEAHIKQSMEHMPTAITEHEHHHERAPFFTLETNKMRAIGAEGVEEYVKHIKHPEWAFQEAHAGSCTCIDERIPGGQVRLAGSGILLEGGARAAAEMLIAAGVTREVTSHDGCGAAALAKKDGQAFAQEVAAIMSRTLGVPVRHRHISATEMRPPEQFYTKEEMPKNPEYHPAQAVYYDFSGAFNPTAVRELPLGFVTSRRHVGEKIARHDASLAVKIALGNHGLGKHFDTTPVRVIVVARTEEELAQGRRELQETMAEFGHKVAIDGFVAPEEAREQMERHN